MCQLSVFLHDACGFKTYHVQMCHVIDIPSDSLGISSQLASVASYS
jgi:hypothetical protein